MICPLNTENHYLICTIILLHQHWWCVAKWYSLFDGYWDMCKSV